MNNFVSFNGSVVTFTYLGKTVGGFDDTEFVLTQGVRVFVSDEGSVSVRVDVYAVGISTLEIFRDSGYFDLDECFEE